MGVLGELWEVVGSIKDYNDLGGLILVFNNSSECPNLKVVLVIYMRMM